MLSCVALCLPFFMHDSSWEYCLFLFLFIAHQQTPRKIGKTHSASCPANTAVLLRSRPRLAFLRETPIGRERRRTVVFAGYRGAWNRRMSEAIGADRGFVRAYRQPVCRLSFLGARNKFYLAKTRLPCMLPKIAWHEDVILCREITSLVGQPYEVSQGYLNWM